MTFLRSGEMKNLIQKKSRQGKGTRPRHGSHARLCFKGKLAKLQGWVKRSRGVSTQRKSEGESVAVSCQKLLARSLTHELRPGKHCYAGSSLLPNGSFHHRLHVSELAAAALCLTKVGGLASVTTTLTNSFCFELGSMPLTEIGLLSWVLQS